MKKKSLLLLIFTIILSIILASCGAKTGSNSAFDKNKEEAKSDFDQYKKEVKTVLDTYGLYMNDGSQSKSMGNKGESMSTGSNLISAFASEKGADKWESLFSFTKDAKETMPAESKFTKMEFEDALAYSIYPSVIYGECLKNRNIDKFTDVVMNCMNEYVEVNRNGTYTSAKVMYDNKVPSLIEFNLDYVSENDFEFDAYQIDGERKVYCYMDSDSHFIRSVYLPEDTQNGNNGENFLFFSKNGTQGFLIDDAVISQNLIDFVKSGFDNMLKYDFQGMINKVTHTITEKEKLDAQKLLFSPEQGGGNIDDNVEAGWDKNDPSMYNAKNNEEIIEVPENYHLNRDLIIMDYCGTVKEIRFPAKMTVTPIIQDNKDDKMPNLASDVNIALLDVCTGREKFVDFEKITVEQGNEFFRVEDDFLYYKPTDRAVTYINNRNSDTITINERNYFISIKEDTDIRHIKNVSTFIRHGQRFLGNLFEITHLDGFNEIRLENINVVEESEIPNIYINDLFNRGGLTIQKMVVKGNYKNLWIIDADGIVKEWDFQTPVKDFDLGDSIIKNYHKEIDILIDGYTQYNVREWESIRTIRAKKGVTRYGLSSYMVLPTQRLDIYVGADCEYFDPVSVKYDWDDKESDIEPKDPEKGMWVIHCEFRKEDMKTNLFEYLPPYYTIEYMQ